MEPVTGVRRSLSYVGRAAPACCDGAKRGGSHLQRILPARSSGVWSSNPVAQSEPPAPKRRSGTALTPSQQKLLIDSATGCWCLAPFLELSAATGARRGEVLALRWSDVQDGAVSISRSLSQTRAGLAFKETKNRSARLVVLPDSAIAALNAH